jgi:hypothetical protein
MPDLGAETSGQARLTHATWTDKGQQPGGSAYLDEVTELGLTSDEAADVGW